MDKYSVLLSCEHAGNAIPTQYSHLFQDANQELDSHRGWDPGALPLAEFVGKVWNVVPYHYPYSRLLIEPNRSIFHSQLFSEFTKDLPDEQRKLIMQQYYMPYRDRVEAAIRQLPKPVLHLSIHTFTPVFHGVIRNVDLGLLFDPYRNSEQNFCEQWKQKLTESFPAWRIAMNEPYKGVDDGFTTYLRGKFSGDAYLGIELEWNQKWAAAGDANRWYAEIGKSLEFFTRL